MKKPDDCKYNAMIECQPGCRNCNECGWNPVVQERRLQGILRSQSYKNGGAVKCAS